MDQHERERRRLLLDDRRRRAEAEAAEAELDASRLGLAQVFQRWARLGVVVVVELPGQTVQGRVGHLGSAVVALVEDSGTQILFELDVVESARALSDQRAAERHAWTTGHPGSLVALLRERVGREQTVGLDRRSGDRISGVVTGVSDEVVVLRTRAGGDVVVPRRAVIAVSFSV